MSYMNKTIFSIRAGGRVSFSPKNPASLFEGSTVTVIFSSDIRLYAIKPGVLSRLGWLSVRVNFDSMLFPCPWIDFGLEQSKSFIEWAGGY
jgi:hypothetical protein